MRLNAHAARHVIVKEKTEETSCAIYALAFGCLS